MVLFLVLAYDCHSVEICLQTAPIQHHFESDLCGTTFVSQWNVALLMIILAFDLFMNEEGPEDTGREM